MGGWVGGWGGGPSQVVEGEQAEEHATWQVDDQKVDNWPEYQPNPPR